MAKIKEESSITTSQSLFHSSSSVQAHSCGSNAFQGYFDDAKESRVNQSIKQRFKNQVSRFKIQESREDSIKISTKKSFSKH